MFTRILFAVWAAFTLSAHAENEALVALGLTSLQAQRVQNVHDLIARTPASEEARLQLRILYRPKAAPPGNDIIVLLGERHILGAEWAAVGYPLVDAFDRIGIEGHSHRGKSDPTTVKISEGHQREKSASEMMGPLGYVKAGLSPEQKELLRQQGHLDTPTRRVFWLEKGHEGTDAEKEALALLAPAFTSSEERAAMSSLDRMNLIRQLFDLAITPPKKITTALTEFRNVTMAQNVREELARAGNTGPVLLTLGIGHMKCTEHLAKAGLEGPTVTDLLLKDGFEEFVF